MIEEHDEIALDDITIDDVITGDTGDAITDGIDLPDAEPLKEEVEEELGLEEELEELEVPDPPYSARRSVTASISGLLGLLQTGS